MTPTDMELINNTPTMATWTNASIWNETAGGGAGNSTSDGGWLPPSVAHSSMALFMWYMHLYCTPAIIAIGLVGNCLSFLVFTCTSQKHLSSSVYLAALAVVDSTFLLQLTLLWPTYLRVFLIHQQGLCQLVIYISYVASFLSVWLVVAFTVERFIVCMDPLRRSTMCTTGRAKAVVAGLSVFAVVGYSYNTWTSTVMVNDHSHRECTVRPQFRAVVDIISLIDSFITMVVPVLAIIVMNLKIVMKVLYFEERRQSMVSMKSPRKMKITSDSNSPPLTSNSGSRISVWECEGPGSKTRTQTTNSTRNRSQMKVTKMLLVVSSIFLLLNVPSHALRVYDTFQSFFNPNYRPSRHLFLWQQGFTFLFNFNFSVNFFLYSLCGTSFRKALSGLLKRYWSSIRHRCCCLIGGVSRRGRGSDHRESSPFRFITVFQQSATYAGPSRITNITTFNAEPTQLELARL